MPAMKLTRAACSVVRVVSGALVACSGDDRSATGTSAQDVAQYGRTTTTSVNVSSVAPDSGALATTLDVKINGSGFVSGMVAVWKRSGVADPTQITTNSTRWVSSKQLIANITITSTATSGQWDVSVYSGGKTGIGTEMAVIKDAFKVTDPTATWQVPLNGTGLSIQSDGLYPSANTSDYVNGVCNVATVIFASTSTSSGDATLNSGPPNAKCARRVRFVYGDGTAETLPIFANLRGIAVRSAPMTIGATVRRQLHMGTDTWPNIASRCGGFVWGYGVANNIGAGSDSVWVTRVNASTWHVFSDAAPNNKAWCKKAGVLMPMAVDFTVVSSRPMP